MKVTRIQTLHICFSIKCSAKKASRGFEPRSLDSESRVLTVTPRGLLNTRSSHASSSATIWCPERKIILIAIWWSQPHRHGLHWDEWRYWEYYPDCCLSVPTHILNLAGLDCSRLHVNSHERASHPECMIRCSIVVSISACHAEDPGSIPGGGVFHSFSVYTHYLPHKQNF